MISVKQKIALIVIGIFVCLMCLEAGLRIGGWMILQKQNSLNLSKIGRKGACRILCIGESTTVGQYPRFLEEALSRKCGNRRFVVFDAGIGGTTTSIILSKLEENIQRYAPDIIVAMIGINDGSGYSGVFRKRVLFHDLKVNRLFHLLKMHVTGKDEGFKKIIRNTQESDLFAVPPRSGGKYARSTIDDLLDMIRPMTVDSRTITEAEKKLVQILSNRDRRFQCRAAMMLAELYAHQKRDTEADAMVTRALAAFPGDVCTGRIVTGRLIGICRFDESERLLQRLMDASPELHNEYWPHLYLGIIFRNRQMLDRSEKSLRQALALEHSMPEIYKILGEVLWRQKKLSGAEAVFKEALTLFPEHRRINGMLGALYLETGRERLAEKYLWKVDGARDGACGMITYWNYRRVIEIVRARNIRMVCMQYPMRRPESLLRMLESENLLVSDIVVVDNEESFKGIVKREGSDALFTDRFGGDFGHCNERGNRLIAENLASAIAKNIFGDGTGGGTTGAASCPGDTD